MFFLTNGRVFLGPYSPGEVRPRVRGEQWLRELDHAAEVFRVEADTEIKARRAFRLTRKGT
jgi:hypothetical protein